MTNRTVSYRRREGGKGEGERGGERERKRERERAGTEREIERESGAREERGREKLFLGSANFSNSI